MPGADCNPYLATTGTLAADYLRMSQVLKPTEPHPATKISDRIRCRAICRKV